jgi:hypothetical protein
MPRTRGIPAGSFSHQSAEVVVVFDAVELVFVVVVAGFAVVAGLAVVWALAAAAIAATLKIKAVHFMIFVALQRLIRIFK